MPHCRVQNRIFVVLAFLLQSSAQPRSARVPQGTTAQLLDTLATTAAAPDAAARTAHDTAAIADSSLAAGQSALPALPAGYHLTQPHLTAVDSLSRARTLDSLDSVRSYQLSLYERFPAGVDSLYFPFGVTQHRIYPSDALAVSEVVRAIPGIVRVPFCLAGLTNRFLPYGHPAPIAPVGDGLLNESPFGAGNGSDIRASSEIAGVSLSGPHSVNIDYHPRDMVSPEMAIFWENGLFNGNTLGIRFARPLSRRLSMAVFSNYRFLAGKTYSHRSVDFLDVHRLVYQGLGLDTTSLATSGYNPLANEHISGFRLAWPMGKDASGHIAYRYRDTKNHLLFLNGDSLRWENLTWYGNSADAAVRNAGGGPVFLDAGIRLDNDVVRTTALGPLYADRSRGRRGWLRRLTAGLRPSLRIGSDTITLSSSVYLGQKQLYGGVDWPLQGGSLVLGYGRPVSVFGYPGAIGADAGQAVASANGSTGHAWIGGIDARVGEGSPVAARGFARRGVLPYDLPLDVNDAVPGSVLDTYESYGAEAFLSSEKAGLMLAVTHITGIDSASVAHAWPNGMTPYEGPRWVVTMAPSTGRWRGWGLSTRWMLSDAKPYVKSQTDLSYEKHLRDNKLHLQVDIGLDYWSLRERADFGSLDQRRFWSSEIFDLHVKTTVQISSFRMFYKIDNLLNNRIAYVPGYFMPGLTFRWGISWIIPG